MRMGKSLLYCLVILTVHSFIALGSLFSTNFACLAHLTVLLSSTPSSANPLHVLSKSDYDIRRCHNSQFHTHILSLPLLDVSPTSPVLSEEIPSFSVDETGDEDDIGKVGFSFPV